MDLDSTGRAGPGIMLDRIEQHRPDIFLRGLKEITKNIQTPRDELKQLCYTIKGSIESNVFSLGETQIKLLIDKINETLDWLLQIEINEHTKDTQCEMQNIEYTNRINDINSICNKLYQTMVGINIDISNNILGHIRDNIILEFDEDPLKQSGTSIQELKRLKELHEKENKVNNL